jgi:hypothetical protein
MGVRFQIRFFFVLLFVLSSLQRGSAAHQGDLIGMNYLGRYSTRALERLNDEFYQLSAGALPALWAQRLYETAHGRIAEVTLMGAVTAPETFVQESLNKVGRYYHVYDTFAFEAWINTSDGRVSASNVFKDPTGIASLFDMDHSYNDVIAGLQNTAGATDLPAFLRDFQSDANHPARVFLKASDATVGWCPKAPIVFHHFEEDTEVSFDSVVAAQAALDTCSGSGGATLVRYDSTAVPRLAYRGAEHLELWDNLLPQYADGTLPGLTW